VLAGQLKRTFSADIFEIRAATAWPKDYEEMVTWAPRMRESAPPPRLAEVFSDMSKYDVVFLGSPICGSALPDLVRTFLITHDLSGQMLVLSSRTDVAARALRPRRSVDLLPARKSWTFCLTGARHHNVSVTLR
jgi:Flavodoxin